LRPCRSLSEVYAKGKPRIFFWNIFLYRRHPAIPASWSNPTHSDVLLTLKFKVIESRWQTARAVRGLTLYNQPVLRFWVFS
jgi:hypothetical protein